MNCNKFDILLVFMVLGLVSSAPARPDECVKRRSDWSNSRSAKTATSAPSWQVASNATVKIAENEELEFLSCSICQDKMNITDDSSTTLHCGHQFYKECEWLNPGRTTFLLCRQRVSPYPGLRRYKFNWPTGLKKRARKWNIGNWSKWKIEIEKYIQII